MMMFVAHLCQKFVCGHLGNGTNYCIRLFVRSDYFVLWRNFISLDVFEGLLWAKRLSTGIFSTSAFLQIWEGVFLFLSVRLLSYWGVLYTPLLSRPQAETFPSKTETQ